MSLLLLILLLEPNGCTCGLAMRQAVAAVDRDLRPRTLGTSVGTRLTDPAEPRTQAWALDGYATARATRAVR